MTTVRTRMTTAISGLLLLTLGLAGCSAGGESTSAGDKSSAAAQTKAPEPVPNLAGKWKQSNSKDETRYQTATIKGNTIEVDYNADNGDTTSLFWAGSFTPPTRAGTYSWVSKNDTSKTKSSLLASNDKTKTFTYANGEISYHVSLMGVTTTMRLKRK